MKLLIMEDNQAAGEALGRLLQSRMAYLDYKVVGTLAEGLRWSHEFCADVTLLDLMLPDAPISEVIHSIPAFHPPVVVVTEVADHDNAIMLECFAYEAKGFHTKRGLLGRIDSLEGQIAADRLVRSIIDAHFVHTLPVQRGSLLVAGKDER